MNGRDGFANEPDLARLSRAYVRMATDWPYALSELTSLADLGSVMSVLYIAQAYQRGIGTPVDLGQYEKWLHRAKDAGSALAAYKLGLFYLRDGKYDKAESNLLHAASFDFVPALARLGLLYSRGNEFAFDKIRAKQFLERASLRGHISGKRDLAVFLIRGKFGVLQKLRGMVMYVTLPYVIAKVAYRHSRLSDDGSSMRYLDEQIH